MTSHGDDISVVVPTLNAAHLLRQCLTSVRSNGCVELIVVDGNSQDGTTQIAAEYGAKVLNDGGLGLPVARALGIRAASRKYVLLLDADVVLPDGSLVALLEEFERDGYDALQAGLSSVADGGYWGQALAHHHRGGHSKNWFGVAATIFERDFILDKGFDERFTSGEDIELRWRLRDSGAKIGVSTKVTVVHRFADDSFGFALDQFRADGRGLGRMVRKHKLAGLRLLALPAVGAIRGVALSLVRRQPRWIPYFLVFGTVNYVTLIAGLLEKSSGKAT